MEENTIYENRNFMIFNVSELVNIDFTQVLETSIDTVRKSIDETKTFVKWDGKLYMCGVRRDTKPNGEGRMELSEIVDGKEVSRFRIEKIKIK